MNQALKTRAEHPARTEATASTAPPSLAPASRPRGPRRGPLLRAAGNWARARAIWAFAHGMVMLELDQRFPRRRPRRRLASRHQRGPVGLIRHDPPANPAGAGLTRPQPRPAAPGRCAPVRARHGPASALARSGSAPTRPVLATIGAVAA
jgi:hypothetical protein